MPHHKCRVTVNYVYSLFNIFLIFGVKHGANARKVNCGRVYSAYILKPRNYIQERPTHIYAIVYCTLWEECKQTQCPHSSWRERTKALMWYYIPTKNQVNTSRIRANTYDFWLSGQYGKYNMEYILIPSLGPFSFINDALPLNFLFWSPPTALHRFDASAVPGLYISWFAVSRCLNKILIICYNLIKK